MSSNDDSVSVDSEPQMEAVYPVMEEVEVPGTDGGLHKTVLVEGTGNRPVKGSKVTVHYVGKLEDGTIFDSSRDRGDYFEFNLGRGQVIKGWDKGVATMRIGEKSVLKCSSEYGYGAAGSPPKIPPNATLFFEVELFHWTREVDISKAKDRSLMKSILKDGVDYANPAFESKVKLSLLIYLGNFDPDDKEKNQKPIKVVSDWEVEAGITLAPPYLEAFLYTMRSKEAAACRVRSDLIPKAVPEFNIPSLEERGNSDITYVVEIDELSHVKTYDFSGIEKVNQGAARKDRGNAAFKEGNLELAEAFYRRAIEFIGEDYGFEDEAKKQCHEVRVSVMGNLAQVLLMRGKFSESMEFSQKVLALDGSNAKALFRIAKALNGLQDWPEALHYLEKLLAMEPDNAPAVALRAEVEQQQKAYDKKQKSLFKKMFA